MTAWCAVDLDGTLAESYWPTKGDYHPLRIGDPIPAMVARVRAMLDAGEEIRIFTARVGPRGSAPLFPVESNEISEIRGAIREWTWKHLGQSLEATCVKDYGMRVLYDDRAVRIVHNTGEPCCPGGGERPKMTGTAEIILASWGFPKYLKVEMATFTDAESLWDLPQREQLRVLIESAVVKVYGSTWTTPECRAEIAEAALEKWDAYDAVLAEAVEAWKGEA